MFYLMPERLVEQSRAQTVEEGDLLSSAGCVLKVHWLTELPICRLSRLKTNCLWSLPSLSETPREQPAPASVAATGLHDRNHG